MGTSSESFLYLSLLRLTDGNDTLKDLLMLNTDGILMDKFNPDLSIDLWWKAKTWRPDQKKRKKYKKRAAGQKLKAAIRQMARICWMTGTTG